MEGGPTSTQPAWLTDDLVEEWVSQDEDQRTSSDRSQPISDRFIAHSTASQQSGGTKRSTSSPPSAAGTVCVRDDIPATTPIKANFITKGIFSPLALERMFEPPSPPNAQEESPSPCARPAALRPSAPTVPSRLSQVYTPGNDASFSEDTDTMDGAGDFEGAPESEQDDKPDVKRRDPGFQFTFSYPNPSPLFPAAPRPNALITPGRPNSVREPFHGPPTDPRLRLFQLNYDTFTREHMSAMVDSMQLNTPSGNSDSAFSKHSMTTEPSQGLTGTNDGSISRLRSAKRLKLSPTADFRVRGDGEAVIVRPQLVKDYVGESKSFMEKIKQAQEFSTITTVGSGGSPGAASKNPPISDRARTAQSEQLSKENIWAAASSQQAGYTSLSRKQGAVTLMEQIRQDMKRHKRLLSVDTEVSERSSVTVPYEEVEGGDTEIIGDANGKHAGEEEEDTTEYLLSETNLAARFQDYRATREDAVNTDLSHGISNISIDSQVMLDQFPAPPIVYITSEESTAGQPAAVAYTSASIRRKEDLTRFVSSSTASGTTLTANSAASFVKHQGPKFMMQITPNDVAHLPDRVGKMVFDRTQMKWIRASDGSGDGGTGLGAGSNDSEDPFKDIESFRLDDSQRERTDDEGGEYDEAHDHESVVSMELDQSRLEEPDESEEDEEEAELNSFSCDIAQTVPEEAVQPRRPQTAPVFDDEDPTGSTGQYMLDLRGAGVEGAFHDNPLSHKLGPALQDTPPHLLAPPAGTLSTPAHGHATGSREASHAHANTPVTRSAMKQGGATPVSAMKDPSRSKMNTPAHQIGHRRSVSFSDGKRDGPIAGLGRNLPTPTPDTTLESADEFSEVTGEGPSGVSSMVPSVRTKRIADMLEDLEDVSYDDTPSKTSTTRPPTEALPLPVGRRAGRSPVKSGSSRRDTPRRSSSLSARSSRSLGRNVNSTFLTECSFGVAHDKLVQVLTDVQPYEPYWDELTTVDLSQKNLDSVARLKEFTPRLDSLVLNANQLSWLSGVPSTVRTLSVASNRLTAVTSFSHLLNLENLDISRNAIDSLRRECGRSVAAAMLILSCPPVAPELECLRHLRELRADGNLIRGLDGLQKMDGLVKLSLQGNSLEHIDLAGFRWTRLEMLNLSQNRLVGVAGLASLPALIALNLDNNHLAELAPGGTMARLRILRASGNRLQQLDGGAFPGLRTLYADNNCLGPVLRAHRMAKLDNLSLRNQNGRAGLSLAIRDVRDVKRLYLSGNALAGGFLQDDDAAPSPLYQLAYLELAACALTRLPRAFAALVPNVRVLNLNYNFIEDVRPLEGLRRVRKLSMVGGRVAATRMFVRMVRGMREAEVLDLRGGWC
ncbi:hypothetical protein EIP86_010611 [Pleurotus ostreatoroseus]|nr:hypothetical protein EIP86_010611 [Pleurotus ostreatoroseus]